MEETRVTEANDEQQQPLVESETKQSEEKEKQAKGEEQSEESHKKAEANSREGQELAEEEQEQGEQEQEEPVPPRKEEEDQPQQQLPPPSKKEEQRSAAPPKPQAAAAAANSGGGWGWGSLWSASSALVNDYILPLVGDTDEEQAEKREETKVTNDAVKHQEEEEEEQDRAVELGKAAYSYVESMASAASSSLSAALSDKAVLERGREVGEWSTTMSFEFLERMGKATFDVLSKELAAAAAGISPQEDQTNTTASQRNDFAAPSLSHQDAASSDRSSFEACFEEKHGSIHLQALENLSTQCVVRLGQADGDLLAQLQESFQSIKDVLAQEEEDEDDEDDDEDEDDEEEHEDESVGKDKRQAKDAKKASASPLPVNGLNRRARLKKKMIESFVKEAKNKVEELASFYEGELQEAVEEMKGKEDSAVTEHIMKTALEGFDKVCYQSMLILSELSANGIELLLRVAESYLVLEDAPARKEEPLERANFITALTTYLLKEVSELAMAYTRCLAAIKDCAGKANAASSAELAKVMTKESLRIHAYAGSASTNLECKSLFVSICQASLLLREEEQRKGQ